MPNISRSKGNQAKKLGRLIEYNVRNSFLENRAENEVERLVPDPFWFLKKFYGHVFFRVSKKRIKRKKKNITKFEISPQKIVEKRRKI